mmetsp:Transcript_65863/g.214320  ORF Transcript_65863/g.214320 Transcript_65863/m.214320 type:complete len:311 (+) Transcript_65863:67-999(+)
MAAIRYVAVVRFAVVYSSLLGLAMQSGWPPQASFVDWVVDHERRSHRARPRSPEVPGFGVLRHESWRRGSGTGPAETFSFLGVKGRTSRASACSRNALARDKLQGEGGPCDCGSGLRICYGLPDDERATSCRMCRSDRMIRFSVWTCTGGHQAFFGHRGDPRPTCCSECKETGMVNVKDKHCACGRRPAFGYHTDDRATCCASCRSPDMVNIRSPRCACGTNAQFGLASTLLATHCQDCQLVDMVRLRDSRCKACGIDSRRPYFGLPDDALPHFCSACKTDDMVNFNGLQQIGETAAKSVKASLRTRKAR